MYEFIIHNDASSDIRKAIDCNRTVGIRLFKAVQQLRADQDALDRLTQNDWGGSPARPRPRNAKFNTGPWGAAQKANMNLWRLRFFEDDLEGFRLIHAFFPALNRYVLLAVTEKAVFGEIHDERFNYELEHPVSIRIAQAYQALVDEF